MKKFNIESFMPSEEEMEKLMREEYEEYKNVPENMSYWYPKLVLSNSKSILKMPETKIIPLPFEWWSWLSSDSYSQEKKNEFREYLLQAIGDFQQGKEIFLKTGVFSNKFVFKWTICNERRDKIEEQFLNIFYSGLVLGANMTSELVVREFVKSKEDVATIYEGMPLHTEFRVFYDFDKKDVIGISNYWNPEIMTFETLRKDYPVYNGEKERIVSEYELHKSMVLKEVAMYMEGVKGLSGKWSVDVMKSGNEYWIIDLARMERSALVEVMEEV